MMRLLPSFSSMQRELMRYRLKSLSLSMLFCMLFLTPAHAVSRRYAAEEDNMLALREMRDSIDSMRHEVDNHETEMRMFGENINNQETTLVSLRQLIQESNQSNKDQIKGGTNALEMKIAHLESLNKSLIADMSQLKNHVNSFTDSLTQYEQKIRELERKMTVQSQNIDNMQEAIRSLVDAMQFKESKNYIAPEGSSKVYRIKAGDSLEKIARNNNTTVKALKEINHLTNENRIVADQIILLP